MGWELVQDGKRCKCWLNLDEIGKTYKGYDWKNSVGKKIGIRYKWYYDEVEEKGFVIINYENQYLSLVDKNKNIYMIFTSHLIKGKQLAKFFGKINDDFRYNIGDEINGMKLIDKEYKKDEKQKKWKYYKCQCIKCGNIDWKVEGNLKKGKGCRVCSGNNVIKGINDISTTHPHLCKYFANQNDIYKYSYGSDKKILLSCPECKHKKYMTVNKLVKKGFSCPICSDGISYPEKILANILTQLNIKFQTQLSSTTFNWCQTYRYDFYLSDYNAIIEIHGLQHYRYTGFNRDYEEEQENDMFKYDIAVLNGFEYNKNYFIIDSRKSTLEWMKKNIIETLGHIFDLSNIDWEKANLECQKSHMILACQLKKENPDLRIDEIAKNIEKKTNILYHHDTIRKWLKRGNEIKLCYYNGKQEHLRVLKENHKKQIGKKHPLRRKVIQKDLNGNIIKIWDCMQQICEELNYKHGTLYGHINGRDKGKPYKGYIWEYVE